MPWPYRSFQGRFRPQRNRGQPAEPVGWKEAEAWENPAAATKANAESDEALSCTPWRDRAELLAVRDMLYARDEDGGDEGSAVKKRRLGIGTVSSFLCPSSAFTFGIDRRGLTRSGY